MASKHKSTPPDAKQQRAQFLFLRDQKILACCISIALIAMAVYWFVQGGHRGDLIEIDRADPLEAQFAVDINGAAWPELTQLPGVGETLARRIVASRETEGPFLDHNDLRRVPGIGPRTLENIGPYLQPMPDANNVAGQ